MTANGDDDVTERQGRRTQLVAALFGDRIGLSIFLGALVSFVAWWRIGFFITDSTTIVNTLVNVADGRLAVVDTPYSLTIGSQPGLHRVGDQLFGRNYGQVLLALPVLWALEFLGVVVDTRLLLAGGWSLLVVGFAGQIARVTDRRQIASLGSAVALVLFVVNVATATSLSAGQQPWAAATSALSGGPNALIALQITTMLGAAVVATTMYRLLKHLHGQRVGIAAGIAVVLATPLSFWASIPKRHVFTAAAGLLVLYWFAVSREATGRHRLARAGAYATLGVLTTIHAFEAFFLFLVLVPLDLLTAPSNGSRSLGFVGVIFVLSLVPLLVLNTLMSGNPLRPPRMLPGIGVNPELSPGGELGPSSGGGDSVGTGGGSGGSGGSGGTGGESGGLFPVGVFLSPLFRAVDHTRPIVGFAADAVVSGVEVLTDPGRIVHTFVRSGQIASIDYTLVDFEAIELTLLESFPLAAALVWLPFAGLRRVRASVSESAYGEPARQTDLLATGFAVVFTLVYLHRLPLHSQITVRYILPVVPFLVYGVARLPVVRRPIETRPRWLAGSYLVTVIVGSVVVLGTFAVVDPAIGEAMQFHALVGLGTATIAAGCAITWRLHRDYRVLAVGLALPAGMTTVFLTLSSVAYFDYGTHALGVVREVAGVLPVL
ncbi:MAG: putative membrane protein YgcG [Haloarculaceae archaeon]|jgi:uncharacterized membrane protein YgcG